ncbi:pyridoxal 5'-phosphate synthase glutaminase subunit PdxT [Pseudalkalibacillus salsuginis]|uniref:pyridoxal 5'-phosphate synthase glutaminase subunit PdxT n=1 Tax=Pseudalkalibacillus salsuginis TaxID=2910972 RepID=UPI001F3D5C32|nr:pyridoxal 5'-phosphate synthase glutaminase subunit PdxT [Pseudalkalibacillus salsuginis]MCF6411952.1 pyridoxal 5'-phosphate synthase glutaminase subunit PdxT [Pseudalkalibacillus salsuginis]
MVTVGILALQGAIREHARALEASGANVKIIKRIEDLEDIDGLVVPGGESTTMRRLIDKYEMFKPLQDFAKTGKPVFGTCAGLILMAREIIGQEQGHLEVMDMKVHRNGFGRQRESFEVPLTVKGLEGEGDYIGVFIRAPYIDSVGPGVEELATFQDRIVAARQGRFLCCAFHPELTDDHRMHGYFVGMVEESKKTFA